MMQVRCTDDATGAAGSVAAAKPRSPERAAGSWRL